MTPIVRYIKPLMLVSGALTTTMIDAAIVPAAALQSTFGESLSGPVAEVVVRNWGVLIAMVGVMVIHGAVYPATRRLALTAASISKVAFIGLVLSNGGRFLGHGAGTAVAVDSVMVVLFVSYLIATGRRTATQSRVQLVVEIHNLLRRSTDVLVLDVLG